MQYLIFRSVHIKAHFSHTHIKWQAIDCAFLLDRHDSPATSELVANSSGCSLFLIHPIQLFGELLILIIKWLERDWTT